MMPWKLATLGLLKMKYFEVKIMTSWFLSMASPMKFYHFTQITLHMLSCDQKKCKDNPAKA